MVEIKSKGRIVLILSLKIYFDVFMKGFIIYFSHLIYLVGGYK